MRLASFGLLLGAAALAAILAWEVGVFAPVQPPAAPPPRVSVATATVPAVAPDRTNDWVNAILARPLFSPDRRPAAAGSVPVAQMDSSLPRLSGVLVGPFGRRAIFAADGSKPVVVGEGGQVSSWTVRGIEAGAVRLMGPGGEQVLHPSFAQSDGGTSLVPPQRAGAAPPR
jgi:hypothetical protein